MLSIHPKDAILENDLFPELEPISLVCVQARYHRNQNTSSHCYLDEELHYFLKMFELLFAY